MTSWPRAATRLVGTTLVCVTTAACSSLSISPAAQSTARPTDSVVVGIAVPGSQPARLAEIESDIGHRFELIRVFRRWDDPIPDADLRSLAEAGYRIHLSVRPRTRNGSDIPWSTLADIGPESTEWSRYQAWLDVAADLPAGSYFTINHEPETTDSASNGEAAEYVAMWRRMAELFADRGSDTQLVWTMTGGSLSDGRAEDWYPGDDVVDVIGTDSYNWYTCQGSDRPWREFEALLDGPLAFASEHNKPLAVPEFASATDDADPQRRAEWIRNAGEWLTQPDVADRIEFVAWFDVTAPGGVYPDCIWDYDVDRASRDAFTEMVGRLAPE